MEQMRIASKVGAPPMRPLFFNFPNDPASYNVEDQFMFGPDLLIAPVTEEGAVSRTVYLPAGANWVEAWSKREYKGGQDHQAEAPLERIPVYWRKGSPFTFQF